MAENTNTSEEVDLGQLFKLIGNGFKNMFNGILNLFKWILHNIIITLIFLKKHAIVLGIATILGGVLGYVLQMKQGDVFESEMILETNFGSGHHLYKQVDFLNVLINNNKDEKLATIFNIPKEDAKSLLKFDVEPYNPTKNLLKEYDYFVQNTDTIYTKDYTFKDFSKRYKAPDYRYQKVVVKGLNKNVFSALNKNFTKLIENPYFRNLLDLQVKELDNRKKVLEKNLAEIDSLRKVYKEVDLLNAKNASSSGTSINLANKPGSTNKDVDLFKESNNILYALKSIDKDRIRNGFIVHKITEFSFGEKTLRLVEKMWFLFAVLGFLLALSFILLVRLNKYLKEYTVKG